MPLELTVSGICERDLDLLFAEEMAASDRFRTFLMDAAGFALPEHHTLHAVRRGPTHSTGESDLELEVVLSDSSRAVLLIENKVDAALQDRQAERYRERAASFVAEGRCSVARTLVIAPDRYFAPDDDTGFDASLTYEQLLEWFRSSGLDSHRRGYKEALIGAAIERAILGYQRVADKSMVSLWNRYARIASELAPELEVPEADGRPSGSHFVYFRADGIPKPIQLVHKFSYGHVDIQLPRWGSAIGRLRQEIGDAIPPTCLLVRAEKSAVLRRKVPRVNIADAPEVADVGIRAGLIAAKELLAWARANAALLNAFRNGPA